MSKKKKSRHTKVNRQLP